MSAAWSWASLAAPKNENPAHGISKAEPDLSTCPKMQGSGQVDRLPRPLEYTADDWKEFCDERAGVSEHCGGMSRENAERQAYEACISKWLDTHLPAINPDLCTHCGKPADIAGRNVIITASGNYLHSACHAPWMAQRRQHAIMALAGMGISPESRKEQGNGEVC